MQGKHINNKNLKKKTSNMKRVPFHRKYFLYHTDLYLTQRTHIKELKNKRCLKKNYICQIAYEIIPT